MQTIEWEWLDKMIIERSKEMRDGEEYHSYALCYFRDRLERCKATGATPNFQMLLQWSVLGWIRYQSTRDADHNIGLETRFIDKRSKPDEQVMVKLDTEDFCKVLNANQRRVLNMTLQGYSGLEIAAALKRAPGRVSQIRDEIRMKAIEFMPEYC